MPKVGRIIGLNALPLWLGLEERLAGQVEFVDDVPGRLNEYLSAGTLDVSMASAWHVAQGEYRSLPEVAIAADGAVGSILILSQTPTYARLHCTPHSATSTALCRVLLEGVELRMLDEPVMDVLARDDAVLVIGDQALELARQGIGAYRTDVGALWRECTGRGMVYGRVASQPDADPALVAAVSDALAYGQRLWRDDPDAVLAVAERRFPFPVSMMRRYLNGLRWDLGADVMAGLNEFLRRAQVAVAR